MYRRLRAQGPVVLVPLAWTVVILAHLDVVADRAVLVFHIVAAALIVVFTASSWAEMEAGALRVWRDILLVGLVLTVGGIVGLLVIQVREPFLTTTILGWMVVPGIGLYYTGKRVSTASQVYNAAAALSVIGAVVYAVALFPPIETALIAAVGVTLIGQTVGIAQAVRQ